jgi:hypothetical protein
MPKSQKNTLEIDLYPALIDYYHDQNYLVELELPLHHNRIDMLAFNGDETVAIELKLKNWKRALRQATYYQLGADYSYIAMPFYSATELYKRKHHLEKEGVGLFAILIDKNEVRELVKPKISLRKVEYVENGLLSLILNRRENDDEEQITN